MDEKQLKAGKEKKKMLYHFKIEEVIYNSDNIEGFLGDDDKPKKDPKPKEKPKEEKAKPKDDK